MCTVLYSVRDIAILRINLSLKTVQLCPPIFGQFCEKLIFCFSPKYLGLTVLTKYFVNKNVVCFLRKALIFVILSYLWSTFTPSIHDIHKKAFLQSCRYGEYLSVATLVIHIPVFGAEQFAFPCNVFFFFSELQLKKF